MNTLRYLLASATLFVTSWSIANGDDSHKEPMSAVEMTFIAAHPGEKETLKRYIQQNWFAMDCKAVEQGLMTSFEMLENTDAEGEWQLMVMVSYPQSQGYEGIQAEFEAVRASHREVKVEGKGFQQLGRVVNSIKVLRSGSFGQQRGPC